MSRIRLLAILPIAAAIGLSYTSLVAKPKPPAPDGQAIFHFDTFGDEDLWTDVLRMHEVIASSVSPATALSVGLKVDAEALPPGFLATADLGSPATTVELIRHNAVVGVVGTVEGTTLTSVGITCALCHSTVDDSVMKGIGRRVDGPANRDLDPGAIIALSPALTAAQKAVYNSWGPGFYDPRFNVDGINGPILIPPIHGLKGVGFETYTGDGPISYWNRYVAVTQMGGHGSFSDPRIGVSVTREPDLVAPQLPALLQYQLGLKAPAPPAGSFDAVAARRGAAVFKGRARCDTCHAGEHYTDVMDGPGRGVPLLHEPAETGMDPGYASRTATGRYRTTPLRGLQGRAPYFHDGSASDLAAVVEHYDRHFGLGLTVAQKRDLAEFLKTL